MGADEPDPEPTEGELIVEQTAAVVAALSGILAQEKGVKGHVDGWAYAALVGASAAHHPTVRSGLWRSGAAGRLLELAAAATAAEIGSTLEVRSGWLYTAASWIVEAEETGARQPPRSLIQRIEDGSAPSEQECAELQARASELAPHGGPPEDSAAEDDGLSDADRELEQQQMVRNAANMDFDQLCHASSLPTLLKLLAIPQLRERAVRTVCRIALRSEPPDLRTAAQKRLQRAALKTTTARGLGLWARPKTMSEILDEANWVVNEAGDARAARTTGLEKKMAELAGFGQIEGSGADGDGAAGSGVDPVSKEELTALLQKHVTWGFVGGSDRFRVRVRKVISRTEGPAGLQVLPAIDKRGPEHAIGEHHVSVAIWGKPGDVGEKPLKPSDEDSGGKNTKKQQAVEEKHGTMSRFNSGRELVGDVRSRTAPGLLSATQYLHLSL